MFGAMLFSRVMVRTRQEHIQMEKEEIARAPGQKELSTLIPYKHDLGVHRSLTHHHLCLGDSSQKALELGRDARSFGTETWRILHIRTNFSAQGLTRIVLGLVMLPYREHIHGPCWDSHHSGHFGTEAAGSLLFLGVEHIAGEPS